ncbi:MAG: hypothetical protein ACRELF_06650, partial [Gemmataceae bacterium]
LRSPVMVNNSVTLFCELMFVLFIGTMIGAVVLQLACALYNLCASIPRKQTGVPAAWPPGRALKSDAHWALYDRVATQPGVSRPGFDRAVLIVLVATLVNAPGAFFILQLLLLTEQVAWYDYRKSLPDAWCVLPMGILVLAAINTRMLPARFSKGLLISLLSHVLAAILAAVIVLIVLSFGLCG